MVVRAAWSSAPVGAIPSTPQAQARYIRTQARLLGAAHAIARWQLTFADIASSVLATAPPGTSLAPFASLGSWDTAPAPKPALAPWDSLFAVPHRP